MPRTVFLFVLVCLAGLAAAGCGPSRMLPGGANGADSTPTVEAFPTFTPTTPALSTSADVSADASLPSPTEPDVEPGAETDVGMDVATDGTPPAAPTESGENASAADASTPGAADASTPGAADGNGFVLPTATPAPEEAAPSPAAETDSPAAEADSARLSVAVASVNVRGGPGTDYAAVSVAAEGESFPLTGRNEQGDWWQVCCFEEQPGWLYGPLVEVENGDEVTLAADIPPAPVSVPTPVPQVVQEPEPEPQPVAQEEAPASPDVAADAGTAGSFDVEAQYQIVHYRVLGFDDNNGGIFNKGGQQIIFVTVLDQNGNGVDGAVIKDAVGDKLNVSVGSKGPGKAEIKMDWDPYKLYVAADPSGAVTSQVSNQMNNPYPHIPDVVGMLGPADNEYAICPTVDDRCDPPFYHAHWSYEITFQKVR